MELAIEELVLSALIKQLIKLGKVWQQGINVSPATREEVALNHSEQVDGQTATEGDAMAPVQMALGTVT